MADVATEVLEDDGLPFLTEKDVLDAHAEFGRLDYHMVKEAMGPNWPREWNDLGPGRGIFAPDKP
jgi:hypothetical protein